MNLHLVKLAIGSIRSRRTRSWLTVIGVLIGVTAVVSLLSIGTGVERAVLQQFTDIGYDIIVIAPSGTGAVLGEGGRAFMSGADPDSGPGRGQAMVSSFAPTGGTFDPSQIGQPTGSSAAVASVQSGVVDTQKLVEAVPGVIEAGNLGTRVVSVDGPAASGFLRLTTPSQSFLQAFPSILDGFEVESGTSFTNAAKNEVVVGARSAASLGVGAGDTLTVDGERFTVVGILASSGAASEETARSTPGAQGGASFLTRGLTNTDDSLFVLQERADTLWSGQNTTMTTIVRMATGADVEGVLAGIASELTAQGVRGTPTSVQQIAASIQGALGMIATVLASIAAVALIVGGVGMMNTMYTSVLERTREIGVLKAIGARDGQVLALFLVDSGLMGLIGGVLGLVAGGILSLLGTRLLGPALGVGSFRPVFEASLILGVVAASFVIGALSGAWPAWRASRLNPVEALAAE
ncbi:MAG: ABC transporter permease [Candidatus Bipolaricaulota bacterium]